MKSGRQENRLSPPNPRVREESLKRLDRLFTRLRERNPDVTEEQAVQDALTAIAEHRREEDDKTRRA